MDDKDIGIFIERMEEVGEIWDKEDVRRVYGDVSLEEALQDRQNDIIWFADIISKEINR